MAWGSDLVVMEKVQHFRSASRGLTLQVFSRPFLSRICELRFILCTVTIFVRVEAASIRP